ncbi:gephyrin-like molybdotransferase Glp [Dyella sp. ASV21]|uniref:molybdopterin molybdotransferase MoeA n=1 Tax=Dyella sp. ASV21 TaxID=2795114 RepID=UPI001E2E9A28|nr:gephyrin-like molybdotransferase Glp [Dyella sp. ASV21]
MSHALLDPADALQIIREASTQTPTESCPGAAVLGRILRQPVVSASDLPPFDNSAMDGYALGGGVEPLRAGSEWGIEGEQAAGDAMRGNAHGAWEIMTGARMPDGLDRVIPLEQTERLDNPPRTRLLADVAAGQNVRFAGSDVAAGTSVMAAGTLLAPQHLMLLAALGVDSVQVAARPRVAVLCTGRELVDHPTTPLAAGQIRNSNGPFLTARLPLAGADLTHAETVGDDVDAFVAAVARARTSGAQVIISTGAVSMGRYDFVPVALQQLGAQVLFHKVAIRPGKPLLFARLPDGTLFFGLPGNPVAVAVGLRFFVEPALRTMLGLSPERPWQVPLAAAYSKKPRLDMYLKSRLEINRQGQLAAIALTGQESYRIRPLAEANAWIRIPLEASELPAGSPVDVYGPGHLESPSWVWSSGE